MSKNLDQWQKDGNELFYRSRARATQNGRAIGPPALHDCLVWNLR